MATTPHAQPLPGITRMRFSLLRVRSPLLTESLLFSLPAGTEMFHFPTYNPTPAMNSLTVPTHNGRWVSPFGHPRITARLATPRGLSQPPTSFIGSRCQGIHHVLLNNEHTPTTTQPPKVTTSHGVNNHNSKNTKHTKQPNASCRSHRKNKKLHTTQTND